MTCDCPQAVITTSLVSQMNRVDRKTIMVPPVMCAVHKLSTNINIRTLWYMN